MTHVSAREVCAEQITETRLKPGVVHPGHYGDPNMWSRSKSMDALGSVVYAARLDDGLIKIGHTKRLSHRLHKLASVRRSGVELLGLRVGTHDDEQAVHASLDASRAEGREYYRPTAEVLAVVNEMRRDLGMSEVAA